MFLFVFFPDENSDFRLNLEGSIRFMDCVAVRWVAEIVMFPLRPPVCHTDHPLFVSTMPFTEKFVSERERSSQWMSSATRLADVDGLL